MPLISLNEVHRLTGHSREHLRRCLEGVAFKAGPKRAKLFESRDVLTVRIAHGTIPNRNISEAESRRLLNLARAEQVRLANEVTRKQRIPLGDVDELLAECFGNIRRVVVARHS